MLAVLGEFAQARAVNQCRLHRRYQELKASSQLLIGQNVLETGPAECGSSVPPIGSCVAPLQCEGIHRGCVDALLQSLQINIDVAAAELSHLEVSLLSGENGQYPRWAPPTKRVLICKLLQESGQSQELEIKNLLKTRDILEEDRGSWSNEKVATNEYAVMLEVQSLTAGSFDFMRCCSTSV